MKPTKRKRLMTGHFWLLHSHTSSSSLGGPCPISRLLLLLRRESTGIVLLHLNPFLPPSLLFLSSHLLMGHLLQSLLMLHHRLLHRHRLHLQSITLPLSQLVLPFIYHNLGLSLKSVSHWSLLQMKTITCLLVDTSSSSFPLASSHSHVVVCTEGVQFLLRVPIEVEGASGHHRALNPFPDMKLSSYPAINNIISEIMKT